MAHGHGLGDVGRRHIDGHIAAVSDICGAVTGRIAQDGVERRVGEDRLVQEHVDVRALRLDLLQPIRVHERR